MITPDAPFPQGGPPVASGKRSRRILILWSVALGVLIHRFLVALDRLHPPRFDPAKIGERLHLGGLLKFYRRRAA